MRRISTLVGVAARHPLELWDRVTGQLEIRQVGAERGNAVGLYSGDDAWVDALHDAFAVDACDEASHFESAWSELIRDVGRLDVEGHDSDSAFARAIWCAIRHSSATRVVETGVGRGISSRVALEALRDRPAARLWSIDLPPLSSSWASESRSAVPARLYSSWTYVRGSSRRALPRLLADIDEIDVFIQDSRSTVATMSFELQRAWEALAPCGTALVNSVDRSPAFAQFVEAEEPGFHLVAPFEVKAGFFGIACRAS